MVKFESRRNTPLLTAVEECGFDSILLGTDKAESRSPRPRTLPHSCLVVVGGKGSLEDDTGLSFGA
jgi:hypothetical protein